jgi:outer membrane biogenesis lipoprotein LolB
MPLARGILLVFLAAFLPSCALFHAPAEKPALPGAPGADVFLQEISERAASLGAFKGVGSFRVTVGKRGMGGRMAWLGAPPDRFRVEVLSPFGQPVAGVASNGQTLEVSIPSRNARYAGPPKAAVLKELLGAPMEPASLVRLLSGAPPVEQHSGARLETGADGAPVLVLLDKKGRVRERIWLEQDGATVRRATAYKDPFLFFFRQGKILYDAEFVRDSEAQSPAPREIHVSDGKQNRALIRFQRFQPNAEVDASQFTLAPAGGKGETP